MFLRISYPLEKAVRPLDLLELSLKPKATALRTSDQRSHEISPCFVELVLDAVDDLDMALELALIRERARPHTLQELEILLVLCDLELVGNRIAPHARQELVFLVRQRVFLARNTTVQVVELSIHALEQLEQHIGAEKLAGDILLECREQVVECALHSRTRAFLCRVTKDVVNDASE